MAKEKEYCCEHKKEHGAIALIIGLLILANAMWSIVNWPVFVGIIVALCGLVKLLMPEK